MRAGVFIVFLWCSGSLWAATANRVINGCPLVPGTPCANMNLSGQDLSRTDLSGADFSGADLRNATLTGTVLRGANLRDAKLQGADLSQADLSDANLKQAALDGARFTRATLVNATLQYVSAAGTDFRRIKGKSVDFFGADLTNAQFQGANLRSADLTRATTTGAIFKGATRTGILYDTAIDPGKEGFVLRSLAFADGGTLPGEFSCGGISPPLEWLRPPDGTQSYVLLVEDLDFEYLGVALPYGNWGLYNIPSNVTSLAAGFSTRLPTGIRDVANDTVIGVVYAGGDPKLAFGYNAPCPPVFGQKHRFRFTLWALNDLVPEGAFDYVWKEFNFKFAYTWVIPRVLEGSDPKYPDLRQRVIGKATLIATVIR